MRRSLIKRALGAGLTVAASASLLLSAGVPVAHAAQTDTITAAGSDTTQDVMTAVLAADGVPGKTFNVKAGNFQSTPLTVPADGFCLAHTYHNKSTATWPTSGAPNQAVGELAAPDGSGEGRTSLNNSVTAAAPFNGGGIETAPNGCIDIARSSGGRPGTAPATNQYYAYAIDAVTWGSSSLNAPSTLTQSQLQGIYNCTYTDWSQVGGSPGPIQRVLPQNGSGTLSFFLSNLLGVSAISALPASTATCPAIVQIQENQFYDMYHGSSVYGPAGNAAQYPNAIAPYSAGKWSYQAGKDTNPTLDTRAGFRPGSLTVAQGSVTGGVYAVSWNGSAWGLNNGSVVGAATTAPRSENLTTVAGSTTVTLVPTITTVPNVTTTTGLFTITAAAGTFGVDANNSPITGTGIPASTAVSAVSADGSTLTLTKAATASGTVTVSLSSHFNSSDANGTLSGNANIPAGTTITFVQSTTVAQISSAATAAGTAVASTITPLGQVHNVTVASSTQFNGTLNAAAGTFLASDIGKAIDSPCTFGNTKITAIGVGGSTATISPGASVTCSTPFAAKIGFTAVSDGNVLASVGASAPWPGARFVYNVIDSSTPSYTQARDIVGYVDTAVGAKSKLCSSQHDVDHGGADSLIADNGFLPIEPHTSAGGNPNVSCFKF